MNDDVTGNNALDRSWHDDDDDDDDTLSGAVLTTPFENVAITNMPLQKASNRFNNKLLVELLPSSLAGSVAKLLVERL